jgi:hypothetical protein
MFGPGYLRYSINESTLQMFGPGYLRYSINESTPAPARPALVPRLQTSQTSVPPATGLACGWDGSGAYGA